MGYKSFFDYMDFAWACFAIFFCIQLFHYSPVGRSGLVYSKPFSKKPLTYIKELPRLPDAHLYSKPKTKGR